MTSDRECRTAEEHLSADLEGSLGPVPLEALAAHLARCRECAALRESLREVVDILHTLPVPEPAEGLAARAAAAALAARPRVQPRPENPSWLALAAGLALLASGLLVRGLPVGERLEARSRVAGQRLIEQVEQLVGDLEALRASAGAEASSRLDRLDGRLQELRRWRAEHEATPAPEARGSTPGNGECGQGSRTRGLRPA